VIECCINVEDVFKNFVFVFGWIVFYCEFVGLFVCVDLGVEVGYEVLLLYDLMIVKLIVWDVDCEVFMKCMLRVFGEFEIGGLKILILFYCVLLVID